MSNTSYIQKQSLIYIWNTLALTQRPAQIGLGDWIDVFGRNSMTRLTYPNQNIGEVQVGPAVDSQAMKLKTGLKGITLTFRSCSTDPMMLFENSKIVISYCIIPTDRGKYEIHVIISINKFDWSICNVD